jgi:5-formyltetrahydrofolate cyclo-ligase
MSENPEASSKLELRANLRQSRASREPNHDEAARLSEKLGQFCIDNQTGCVAAYFPIAGEPDIREFLAWALHNGLRVLLPIVKGAALNWVQFDGNTQFGELGFDEATGKSAKLADAQVIFMPALAVDLRGNRLGKGKGFYDRALAELGNKKGGPKRVAVVFDEELLLSIPTEAHDLPVDAAITASKLIWFKR